MGKTNAEKQRAYRERIKARLGELFMKRERERERERGSEGAREEGGRERGEGEGERERLSACKISMLQVVFGKFYRQIKKTQ